MLQNWFEDSIPMENVIGDFKTLGEKWRMVELGRIERYGRWRCGPI